MSVILRKSWLYAQEGVKCSLLLLSSPDLGEDVESLGRRWRWVCWMGGVLQALQLPALGQQGSAARTESVQELTWSRRGTALALSRAASTRPAGSREAAGKAS